MTVKQRLLSKKTTLPLYLSPQAPMYIPPPPHHQITHISLQKCKSSEALIFTPQTCQITPICTLPSLAGIDELSVFHLKLIPLPVLWTSSHHLSSSRLLELLLYLSPLSYSNNLSLLDHPHAHSKMLSYFPFKKSPVLCLPSPTSLILGFSWQQHFSK